MCVHFLLANNQSVIFVSNGSKILMIEMINRMRKAGLALIMAWMAIGLFGCQKMKDDIDNLKNPIPTGIVVLQNEIDVQNGSAIQIPFRINPSNYVPKVEDITLDVVSSQITRASYGSSIPELTLTGIQPDKNAQGETIDGQWLATVEAAEGAYYADAKIALILTYTDARGEKVQMTSSSVSVLNSYVKLTDKMVVLNGPLSCTYMSTTTNMPITVSTQLVAQPISEGSSTLFDMGTVAVKEAELTGDKADQFTLTPDESGMKWSITPNSAALEFDEGAQYVPVTLAVKLLDRIGNNEVTVTKTIRFFKTEYTAPDVVEYKLSEWPVDRRQNLPLGDYLAQIGVTAELFTRHNEGEYLPIVVQRNYSVKNSAGADASSSYRAVFQVKNTIPDENPDAVSNEIIAPETSYLQQRFYSLPLEGEYMLWLTFQYSTVESINSSNPQPTIQATIKVPVRIVP